MAKVLLSVRIPDDLMHKIEIEAAKTKKDKTSVTIDLLNRGLGTLGESPLESANYVPVEKFDAAIANLTKEIESIKELEAVA